MNNSRLVKTSSIGIVGGWLLVLALLPLLLVFMLSFLQHDNTHLFSWHFTLKNYQQLIGGIFFKILYHSLALALATTLITLLIGYPFAWIIAQCKSHYKNLFLLLIIIPLWTSSLIRTYAILALIKTKGIINSLLISIGIIHHPLAILYSNTAVLIGVSYNLLPFMILPLYNNMEKLDSRLYDAARDLGANWFTRLHKITLPLTLPGIMLGIIFVFLPAITLFYIPDLLGGAKSLLLGNLIKIQFLNLNDWPGGAATSIVLTVMLLLLAWLYRLTNHKHPRELS